MIVPFPVPEGPQITTTGSSNSVVAVVLQLLLCFVLIAVAIVVVVWRGLPLRCTDRAAPTPLTVAEGPPWMMLCLGAIDLIE